MLAISNQVDIDSQRVLRNIGYVTAREPSAHVASLVNEYVENAYQLIEPSYSCVIRDINSVCGSSVAIEGSVTFESEVIARLLEQCEQAAVFALTIGHHLEGTVRQLAEDGRILQAAVLDAIGSVAVESMADFMQDRVRKVANTKGLTNSQRFSPGYCDWEVVQQKMVFQALGSESAGVRLNEECLMLPRKSMSGIIGIGPLEVESYNPCKPCDKRENCAWKR